MYPLALGVFVLPVLCEVLNYLLPVVPELVVEDPVSEAEGEQQGEDVQGLQEEEVPLITRVAMPGEEENFKMFTLCLQIRTHSNSMKLFAIVFGEVFGAWFPPFWFWFPLFFFPPPWFCCPPPPPLFFLPPLLFSWASSSSPSGFSSSKLLMVVRVTESLVRVNSVFSTSRSSPPTPPK